VSAPDASLGIGIVGAGFMGQTYARTISTLVQGARITAIACGSRAPDLAEEYGVPAEPSLEALLARKDVHAVCIATPHARHGDEALAAARARKHILIDKPMATTVVACDAILAACKERNLRCDITFSQRHRICNVETKRILDSGVLGSVRTIHSIQVVPNGMKSAPNWQLLSENIGVLMGHGIHNIDHVRWVTGKEVVKVFAKLRTFERDCPVDGTSDVVLTLADGTVCTIFCSFEVPAPGIPRTGGATQIACEKGNIDSDWYGELRVTKNGGPWEVVAKQDPIDWAGKGFLDPVRLNTYGTVIQNLVDDIRADKGAGGTGWDGRQAVAVAAAAYESSRTGQEISLTHV
jgi:predicted dehydrogenase